MRLKPLALATVVALAFFAAPAAHAFSITESAGGVGGTPFLLRCAVDRVLVGLDVKVSTLVHSIRPLCVPLTASGTWALTAAGVSTQFAGGSGGTERRIVCPRNEVVFAVQGRSGDLIDRIELLCSRSPSGRVSGSVTVASGEGGPGGSPFGPFRCANAEPAQGLIGTSGDFITRVALACNLPSNLGQSDFIENRGLFVMELDTRGAGPHISRITLRNHTTAELTVPWRVVRSGEVLGARTDTIPANTLRTFEVTINLPEGPSRLFIEADPENTLGEIAFHRFNNIATTDLALPRRVPATCSSGVAVVTPSGTECAIGADVSSCSTPGPFGSTQSFSCAANSDCLPNFVCAVKPCGGICVRKPNP